MGIIDATIDKVERFKLSKRYKYIYFGILCVLFPIVIAIYGIVYFGGLWDPIGHLHNLDVEIINNDMGCPAGNGDVCQIFNMMLPGVNFGASFTEGVLTNKQVGNMFNWKNTNCTTNANYCKYNNAKKTVDEYDNWGVIYIPEDFTQKILTSMDYATFAGVASATAKALVAQKKLTAEMAEGLGAILASPKTQELFAKAEVPQMSYIYDTARSYTSVVFMTTVFETLDSTMKKAMATKIYEQMTSPAVNVEGMPGMAKAYSNTFYRNIYQTAFIDIHPLNNFGENFGSFLLYIIIYIGAIAATLVYRKYRPFDQYIRGKKDNTSLFVSILGKAAINVIYMLIVNVFMVIVLVMFGESQHVHSLFYAYLLFMVWSFISVSFCNTISNLLPLLPFVGISVIFLVVQLATCGGIISTALQPGFWNIGKALPLYYSTAELKYVLFDTGARFSGRNIMAILLWAAGLILCNIITTVLQYKTLRQKDVRSKSNLNLSQMPPMSRQNKDIEKGVDHDITE